MVAKGKSTVCFGNFPGALKPKGVLHIFLQVKFLVREHAHVNFVTFRKSALKTLG